MPKALDITDQRFGRLVARYPLPDRANDGHIQWHCQCDCGNVTKAKVFILRLGRKESCGCTRSERISAGKTKHGKSKTKIYRIWSAMKERCERPDNHAYKNYGGRGITVCKRWQKFENFYADMGERPSGKSLDRINNELGYYHENCRWASTLEQRHNRRPRKPFFRSKVRALHNFTTEELEAELKRRRSGGQERRPIPTKRLQNMDCTPV